MLHPHIRVTNEEVIEGRGLIAHKLIREGEVISRLEPNQPHYAISDVLTWSQEEQDELLHYAYQCSETHYVCEQGSERFMNHSCDPNTWWLDDDTVIARRDIQPGEEITYDYAMTEIVVDFQMECSCGSPKCRGIITNRDYLIPSWQAEYGDHLPRHTLQAILLAGG